MYSVKSNTPFPSFSALLGRFTLWKIKVNQTLHFTHVSQRKVLFQLVFFGHVYSSEWEKWEALELKTSKARSNLREFYCILCALRSSDLFWNIFDGHLFFSCQSLSWVVSGSWFWMRKNKFLHLRSFCSLRQRKVTWQLLYIQLLFNSVS